jgi:hypothetical protein
MLAADFAPYFREQAKEKKTEKQFPKGKSPNPGGKPKAEVNMKSCSPALDIKTMHANSTVGLVAEKAGVSHYKAAQAIEVAKHPELAAQVASGEKPLLEAFKEIKSKNPKAALPGRLRFPPKHEVIIFPPAIVERSLQSLPGD